MHGQKPICNVCTQQFHPTGEPSEPNCQNPDAEFQSELCAAFDPIPHRQLATHVAVLNNMLDICWDVCMILLDRTGALPEVPE